MYWMTIYNNMPPKCLPVIIWIKYKDEDGELCGAPRIAFWDTDENDMIMWIFLPCDCKESEYDNFEVSDWAPLPGEKV